MLHVPGGMARGPLDGSLLRIFATRRRWGGWLSYGLSEAARYWLSEAARAASAAYRDRSSLMGMPRNYGLRSFITRISASSACRLNPGESAF